MDNPGSVISYQKPDPTNTWIRLAQVGMGNAESLTDDDEVHFVCPYSNVVVLFCQIAPHILQTVVDVISICLIHRALRGIRGQLLLDEDTRSWLTASLPAYNPVVCNKLS